MTDDVERMFVCSVCGADAVFGFGVTVEGVRMGDVGDWRCADHHPTRKPRYTREEWADARAKGKLCPGDEWPDREWKSRDDILSLRPTKQEAA